MTLPRADELSRWTVQQVTAWLQEMSLTVFRDPFLMEQIDGSKLMRMHPSDIDRKYPNVKSAKRAFLKDLLSKIEQTAPVPLQWAAAAPQLPPRSGPSRAPAPAPADADSDESSGDDWGSEFEDDAGENEDYLEPTSNPNTRGPPEIGHRLDRPVPTPRTVHEEPQEVYEVVDGDEPTANGGGGLRRRETFVDKLRSALSQRQSQVADDEPAPPPRPPRRGPAPDPVPQPQDDRNRQNAAAPALPPLPATHRPPPPPPQDEPKAPEDVYEVVEDEKQDGTKSDDDDYLQPDPVIENKGGGGYLDLSSTRVNTPPAEPVRKPPKQQRQLPATPSNRDSSPPPRPVGSRNAHAGTPPQQVNNQQATEAMVEGDLNHYPWYHGNIGRSEANRILENCRSDGMFLIRASERNPNQPFTLALWYGERSWNLPIRRRADTRYAAGLEKPGETSFGTILELVEYYKKTTLALKGRQGPRLQTAAPRQ